jgi:hypothetical protein
MAQPSVINYRVDSSSYNFSHAVIQASSECVQRALVSLADRSFTFLYRPGYNPARVCVGLTHQFACIQGTSSQSLTRLTFDTTTTVLGFGITEFGSAFPVSRRGGSTNPGMVTIYADVPNRI